jgi:hypothetical protein
MSLTRNELCSIEPFRLIDCPSCGGREFVELVPNAGVWCEHCNTEFRVRGTSGDPGCVVDAFLDTVSGDARTALHDDGWFVWPTGQGEQAGAFAYRALKEPDGAGGAMDDRGWIVAARDFGQATLRNARGQRLWEYLRPGRCLATPGELRWLRGYRGPRGLDIEGAGAAG